MSDQVSKLGFGKKLGKIAMVVAIIFVGLVILGAVVGSDKQTDATPAVASNDDQPQPEAKQEATTTLIGPQAHAARSAQQYLSMTGFSHDGLIQQLSSDAGEGYSVADATAAVDSLDVDWNEQAAKSAKQYLSMTGFSCKGLTEQLSSDAGDKYTQSQAAYGAQQAGAC